MTKRTRILLIVLGIVTIAAAIWISMNVRFKLREITYTDEAVDVELVEPVAPAPKSVPTTN